MRILITGATGNIGEGIIARLREVGHTLVLYDVVGRRDTRQFADLPFIQGDIQAGIGLDRAAQGCDLVLHTPAWHGIHWNQKTEADFWRLNVDGTFWAYQAAEHAGIKRFVFLSSMAWYSTYDKYGFTKVMGEHLAEYNFRNHKICSVIIRPHDLTPWNDYVNGYGARLLRGGVDREDVLDCIQAAVTALGGTSEEQNSNIIVQAVRANAFTTEQTESWQKDPESTCELLFPGSLELVRRYRINIACRPDLVDTLPGAQAIAYTPKRHFGTFLQELHRLDRELGPEAVAGMKCLY
jgi:hypothetical protein